MAKDTVAEFFSFVRQGFADVGKLSFPKYITLSADRQTVISGDTWGLYAVGKFGNRRVAEVWRNGGLYYVLGLHKTEADELRFFIDEQFDRIVAKGELSPDEIFDYLEELTNAEQISNRTQAPQIDQ